MAGYLTKIREDFVKIKALPDLCIVLSGCGRPMSPFTSAIMVLADPEETFPNIRKLVASLVPAPDVKRAYDSIYSWCRRQGKPLGGVWNGKRLREHLPERNWAQGVLSVMACVCPEEFQSIPGIDSLVVRAQGCARLRSSLYKTGLLVPQVSSEARASDSKAASAAEPRRDHEKEGMIIPFPKKGGVRGAVTLALAAAFFVTGFVSVQKIGSPVEMWQLLREKGVGAIFWTDETPQGIMAEGYGHLSRGLYAEAKKTFHRAAGHPAVTEEQEAMCLYYLGMIENFAGSVDLAEAYLDRYYSFFENRPGALKKFNYFNEKARAAVIRGDPSEARRFLSDGLVYYNLSKLPNKEAYLPVFHEISSVACLSEGRFEEALVHAIKEADIYTKQGSQARRGLALGDISVAATLVGQKGLALAFESEAFDLVTRFGSEAQKMHHQARQAFLVGGSLDDVTGYADSKRLNYLLAYLNILKVLRESEGPI